MSNRISHETNADFAVAELMNRISDGSVDVRSQAFIELTDAINTYLLERGFTVADLGPLWTGEIQLIST